MPEDVIVEDVAVEAPVEESVPTPGAGPWAKDLEALDLGVKGEVVDGYLRETWQPRVTQLEQELAVYRGLFEDTEAAQIAANIAGGLVNPDTRTDMLLYLKNELEWDDVEIAAAVEAAEESAAAEGTAPETAALAPEYQAFLDQMIAEKAEADNARALDEFFTAQAVKFGDGFDRDLYENIFFGMTAKGADPEEIDAKYGEYIEKMTPPAPPAPQVLTGGATPSTEQDPPTTLEEAARRTAELMNAAKRLV